MAVTWPDGSVTGSLRRDVPAAAVPAEPEPDEQPDAPTGLFGKKEVKHGDR